ncbi:hypothetical protein PG990_014364 [Apiospora arundinis]
MAEAAASKPPTLSNPLGDAIEILAAVMLALVTLVVSMRLWGRYRYRKPRQTTKPTLGEPGYWILVSDITILFSYINAVALAAVQFHAVQWGQGLHVKKLSLPQRLEVLKMFFIYQVLYKFTAAISKMASVFLLMAISAPQMRAFNMFCKIFAAYMGLYCIATSLVAVFQCGTNIESNWDKSQDQSKCFFLPPFWYLHAIIDMVAMVIMIGLPWWLFASIQYKRKNVIATIMSVLALGETILGAVRLWTLTKAAASSVDITYSSSLGQIVSQLQINFACIAACIPTVLRLIEEGWINFCVHVLGFEGSFFRGTSQQSNSKRTGGTSGSRTTDIHLKSIERGPQPSGPYAHFDREDDVSSLELVLQNGEGRIQVQTEISVSSGRKNSVCDRDGEDDANALFRSKAFRG